MVQNDEYIEFDLKALLFYILRKWKSIFICGLSIAIVLGSLQAYSEYNTGLDMDMENSYWMEYQQYQDQMTFYEDRVLTTQDKINALQDYIRNSVLMAADHRNVYIAKATYYIDSGYKILPENSYQDTDKTSSLTYHYKNYLRDYSVFEDIGAQVGIDAKYLMELVEVSIPNDYTLSISITHPTEQCANIIMEIVQEKLQEVHLYLVESINEHTITMMMNTCGVYIDNNLKTLQQKNHDELLELQDELILYKQELITMKQSPAPGELNIVTAFIKWFILGGAVGVFLAVAFLFVQSIIKNRLLSASQLVSSFHSIVLGEVICSKSNLSPIAKQINKLEDCLFENSEENLQFLAENIRNHCRNAKNVMICCDADADLSFTLAESLNKHLTDIQLLPVGILLKEANALRTLSECDTVLMVTIRDKSRNATIRKMLKLIQSYHKEILGFIITY